MSSSFNTAIRPEVRTTSLTGAGPQQGRHFRYPQNVTQPPFDKWMLIEAKSGRHVLRDRIVVESMSAGDTTLASAALYLPMDALASQIKVDWAPGDLGTFLGAAIETAAQTGKHVADIFTKGSIEGLATGFGADMSVIGKTLMGILDNPIGMLGGAGSVVSQMAGADLLKALEGISGAGEQYKLGAGSAGVLTGLKTNPRTDITFTAQQYRTHRMSFKMVPRNLTEAQQIDGIVHMFQFYMLPHYQTTDPALVAVDKKLGSFLMGYPYEFELTMYDGAGLELQHVNKIGRSVLRDCLVEHDAEKHVAFIQSGNQHYPVCTTLTLCFDEVRLLGRDSVEISRAPFETQATMDDPRATFTS